MPVPKTDFLLAGPGAMVDRATGPDRGCQWELFLRARRPRLKSPVSSASTVPHSAWSLPGSSWVGWAPSRVASRPSRARSQTGARHAACPRGAVTGGGLSQPDRSPPLPGRREMAGNAEGRPAVGPDPRVGFGPAVLSAVEVLSGAATADESASQRPKGPPATPPRPRVRDGGGASTRLRIRACFKLAGFCSDTNRGCVSASVA